MKKILVVDDDPGLRDAFRMIFEPGKYELLLYPTAEALRSNDFPRPDLIILDRQLSGEDGVEICRSLKARPETKEIPILMLSATPNIMAAGPEAGADESLEKPFRLKDLRTTALRLMS